MPFLCWPCSEKGKGDVTQANGELYRRHGAIQDQGINSSTEERMMELITANETLKERANQVTNQLKEVQLSYEKTCFAKIELEHHIEKQRVFNDALERAHRELEQQLKERDKEIEILREALVRPNKASESRKPDKIYNKARRIPVVGTKEEGSTDVKKTPKTPEQRKFLREAIVNNDFLKHLSEEQINEMIDWMQRTIPSNDTFIKEGTNGDRLYILESGELEVSQGSLSLRNILPPSVFGELALLYNCKRTATVTAKTATKVWMLERSIFQNIMKTTTNTRRAELIQALYKVPLMKTLGSSKLGKLTEVLEEEIFEKGQYIVRQGETGEIFYIIMDGEVDVTEKGQEKEIESFIRTLGKGSYFGEKALRSETGKREANVIAKSKVRCMTLDKKPFLSLIGNMADKDWESAEKKPKKSRPDSVTRLKVAKGPANRLSPRRSHDLLADHIRERHQSSSVIGMPERRMLSTFKDYTLRDFDFIGVLGIGGFGRVELVRLKDEPNRSFALKCMKKTHIVETKQEEHIFSEKQIMRDSDCRFIVQLYKTFKNDKYARPRYVYMLMDACLGGELWAKLRDDGYFDEGRTRFYTACVVEAIEYLHLRGVVYRDLKPENLLLDERGFVKIVDFGFAKRINHGEKTWTFCGTPEYVAPEVILNKGHDVAVDYWALGILIFEMLTGNPPFNSSDAMKTYRQALRGIDAIEWPQKVSKPAQNLIRRLCRENPAERIGNLREGTNDIKNHRWFSGFDWISLKTGTYNAPYVPEIASPTDLRNFDRFEREEEMVEKETSGWDKDF